MRTVIDLTGKMENGMRGYYVFTSLEKIVPPVRVVEIAHVREQDFFSSKLSPSTIPSCHAGAVSHILEGGE